MKAFQTAIERLASKGCNINKVEIDVTFYNLKEFKEIFYVRGNPWAVHFSKIKPQLLGDTSSLAVSLIPKIDKTLNNWVIVGSAAVEILSNKSNV